MSETWIGLIVGVIVQTAVFAAAWGSLRQRVSTLEKEQDKDDARDERVSKDMVRAIERTETKLEEKIESGFAYWGQVFAQAVSQMNSHETRLVVLEKHAGISSTRTPAVRPAPPVPPRASVTGGHRAYNPDDDPRRDR